jgi:hypothetical protein
LQKVWIFKRKIKKSMVNVTFISEKGEKIRVCAGDAEVEMQKKVFDFIAHATGENLMNLGLILAGRRQDH